MTITTAMVKELRELTGVGPLDCKKALETYAGDLRQAADFLREKGLAKAAKKAGRETKTGLVVVKAGGAAACMVEVTCETDFVARTIHLSSSRTGPPISCWTIRRWLIARHCWLPRISMVKPLAT